MKCQTRHELWNALWSIGHLEGVHYVAPADKFDALCREHFSPFAPGEVISVIASPIAAALNAAGVTLANCGCPGRRLTLNIMGS